MTHALDFMFCESPTTNTHKRKVTSSIPQLLHCSKQDFKILVTVTPPNIHDIVFRNGNSRNIISSMLKVDAVMDNIYFLFGYFKIF